MTVTTNLKRFESKPLSLFEILGNQYELTRQNKVPCSIRLEETILGALDNNVAEFRNSGIKSNRSLLIDNLILTAKPLYADAEIEREKVAFLSLCSKRLNEVAAMAQTLKYKSKVTEHLALMMLSQSLEIAKLIDEVAELIDDSDTMEITNSPRNPFRRIAMADEEETQYVKISFRISNEADLRISMYRTDDAGYDLITKTDFITQAITTGHVRIIDKRIDQAKRYLLRKAMNNFNQIKRVLSQLLEQGKADLALASMLSTTMANLELSFLALAAPTKLSVRA